MDKRCVTIYLNNMNILIIVNDLSVSGGTQKTTLKTSLGLQALGHKVTILTSYFNPSECYPEMTKQVNVVALSTNRSSIFLKRVFKSTNLFSIFLKILTFSFFANTLYLSCDSILLEDVVGSLSLMMTIKNKRKIVWYLNNQFPDSTVNIFKGDVIQTKFLPHNLIKRLVTFLMKLLYSISFSKIDYFATYDKLNLKRLNKIGYTNTKLILPGTDIPNVYIRRKTKDKGLNVLSIGTMAPYRRYEDVIEALKILEDRDKTLIRKLIIVGRNDSHHKYYLGLLSLVKKYGLQKKVKFYSHIGNKEIKNLYKSTSVFVFVNDENTWGLSVAEAVMYRVPTIISDNIGISEVLDDKDAYKIKTRDPLGIANSLVDIVNNPKIAHKKTVSAFKKIESRINWNKYVLEVGILLSDSK